MERSAGVPRAAAIAALLVALAVSGCGPTSSASAGDSNAPSAPASAATSDGGSLVIVGRIVTMDDPAEAEALLIQDGSVTAVGGRDEVLAQAGDGVPVLDIGSNVAYPGFVDVHAHWIGDRDHYGADSAADAIDAALQRGWTSISEQWVDPGRITELESLAAEDALPIRVDAYLALNWDTDHYGDWYADREPGSVDDRLRVRGLKIHLDDGPGKRLLWGAADLVATVGRANDAGWQVAVHTMSSAAMDLILGAFEAAIGPDGPNPLHHRIDHAVQVSDEQLARMVAMDIATVIHLDGAGDWLLYDDFLLEFDRDNPGPEVDALARWRDMVDAGLHVASATDAPWTFPDLQLAEDLGRPVDHIAAGMDGQVHVRPEAPSWLRDQLLTVEQALRAVTLDAAWALGDEARRGHLAPGTLGDVTILSGDMLDATPDEIRALGVVATIVGGRVAFCSDSEVCGSVAP